MQRQNRPVSHSPRPTQESSHRPREERRDAVAPYPRNRQRSQDVLPVRILKTEITDFRNDVLGLPETWGTGLPQDTGLTRLELAHLLSNFFLLRCTWHKSVDPRLFLHDLREALLEATGGTLPQKPYSSVMLYNAIIAYALGFSEVESHRSIEFRRQFASEAKKHMDEECQYPTLATVQAFAILASFHSGLAEQGLSFTYLGIAIRVSQTLCLNGGNYGQPAFNNVENQRSFAFWNVFCLDKASSLYVGRRQTVKPFPSEGASWRNDSFADVGTVRCFVNVAGPVSAEDEAFVAHVGLMQIASFIMDFLYRDDGLCRTDIDIVRVEQMSTVLDLWYTRLPPHDPDAQLNVDVMMVKLIFEWITILLFQPFFQDSHSVKFIPPASIYTPNGISGDLYNRISTLCHKARQTAPPAAFRITAMLEKFDNQSNLRMIDNTAVQIAYVAGKMHLMSATNNPEYRYLDECPRQGVTRCIQILRKIGETWPSGVASANRLEELSQPPQNRVVNNRRTPTPPPAYTCNK